MEEGKEISIITADIVLQKETAKALCDSGFGVNFLPDTANIRADKKISLYIVDIASVDDISLIRDIYRVTKAPIIFLLPSHLALDKPSAFKAGAVDYLHKPIRDSSVLLSRVDAAIRIHREKDQTLSVFKSGNLSIDFTRKTALMVERKIHFTVLEFDLLTLLVRKAGQIVTFDALMFGVWGKPSLKNKRSLHIYMQRLREKLGDNPYNPTFIITEPKTGYRFNYTGQSSRT